MIKLINSRSFKNKVIFFIGLVLIIGTTIQCLNIKKHQNNDLRVYYKIAMRMQSSPSSEIYSLADGAFPYRYVPFTLPFINWMSHFDEISVRYIWFSIQVLCFILSLWILKKILDLLGDEDPYLTTALASLIMFRHYLDSLSSGQIFGSLLLCLCIGFYFFINQKYKMSVIYFFVASSLKIMPGMSLVFGFFNTKDIKDKLYIISTFFILFMLFNYGLIFWFKLKFNPVFGLEHLEQLWKLWWQVLSNDSEYFDGSTTKNQALRGFLLRLFGRNPKTELVWRSSFILAFSLLCITWIKHKSQNVYYIAGAFCLSILFYILLMPQSLPYQVMNAIIPITIFIFFIKKKFKLFEKILTILILLTLTFPSSGILGRSLANQLQYFSLPMFTLILLSVYFFHSIRQKRI